MVVGSSPPVASSVVPSGVVVSSVPSDGPALGSPLDVSASAGGVPVPVDELEQFVERHSDQVIGKRARLALVRRYLGAKLWSRAVDGVSFEVPGGKNSISP